MITKGVETCPTGNPSSLGLGDRGRPLCHIFYCSICYKEKTPRNNNVHCLLFLHKYLTLLLRYTKIISVFAYFVFWLPLPRYTSRILTTMLLFSISFFVYHFIWFLFRDRYPAIKEWLIDNQSIKFNKCYPIYASFVFGTILLLCKSLLEAYEVLDTLSKTLEA